MSREGERALVFQISPSAGGKSSREQSAGEESNAEMALYEYVFVGGRILRTPLFPPLTDMTSLSGMGMQIADDTISVFFIDNDNPGDKPYTFPGSVVRLTPGTYKYFAEEVIIGGKTYGGIYTNDVDGKVYAPELRAVFEVEAASNRRPFEGNDMSKIDFLTNFRVSPAYQYDVFLEHPNFVTNRATVAQKIGVYSKRDGRFPTVLTYDTHGTEHKGFRQDEREARAGGGR